MKSRLFSILFILFLCFSFINGPVSAQGPSYSAGDLVIYRVGDGTENLNNRARSVHLDVYDQVGTPKTSLGIALPVTPAPTFALTGAGNVPSEGMIALSADRQQLLLTGYNAAANTNNVANSAVTRVIGRVDKDQSVILASANLTDGNPHGAASVDGSVFWMTGSDGIYYVNGAATIILSTTGARAAGIYDGQLYVTTAAGAISRVGAGLPVTAGQTLADLPGLPTTNSFFAFYMADLDSATPGVDTLYLADNNATAAGGIYKYALVDGTWVARGQVGTGGVYAGLTGIAQNGVVTLFAIQGGSQLMKVVDSSGYSGTLSAVPQHIATAPAGTAFRGIAFTPATAPTAVTLTRLHAAIPASNLLALVGVLLVGLLIWRRR